MGSPSTVAPQTIGSNLSEFRDWLEVVKQYSPVTASGYVKRVKSSLRQLPSFDYEHILAFLKEFKTHASAGHYTNCLAALKAYSRFIGMPDLLRVIESGLSLARRLFFLDIYEITCLCRILGQLKEDHVAMTPMVSHF